MENLYNRLNFLHHLNLRKSLPIMLKSMNKIPFIFSKKALQQYQRATIRSIYAYHMIKLCFSVNKKFQRKRTIVLVKSRVISVD